MGMRRCLSGSLFCAWLLVYPHYNELDTGRWTKLWNSIWYRNTWIAAFAYAEKTPCVAEARTLRAAAVDALRKKPIDQDRIEENRALAQALCVPAETLDILPFRVKVSPWFGAL